MVFYFTGTGNSLFIAKRIAGKSKEKLVSISAELKKSNSTFTLEDGEDIGFVYPVHGFAPPSAVMAFASKLSLKNFNGNYIYSVFNCGGTWEYTAKRFSESLSKGGMTLKGDFHVIMPGNYTLGNTRISEAQDQETLLHAGEKVDEVLSLIDKKTVNYEKGRHSFFMSYVIHALLGLESSVKFEIGSGCNRCGKCAAICPMGAIQITGGKVIRDKRKCVLCLGCINCCPADALNIGKKTAGKRRYIHPAYGQFVRNKKEKTCQPEASRPTE
jgi:ferredoxin